MLQLQLQLHTTLQKHVNNCIYSLDHCFEYFSVSVTLTLCISSFSFLTVVPLNYPLVLSNKNRIKKYRGNKRG